MKKGYWMAMVDVTDPENYPEIHRGQQSRPSTNTARSFWCAAARHRARKARPATAMSIIEFDSYETGARLLQFARIPGGAETPARRIRPRISPSSKAPERDPFPGHRPQGRPVRAPEARRHGDRRPSTTTIRRAQAKAFEDQGFEWLHVVDLNGAFAGQSVNGAAVERDPQGDEKSGAARRRHPHARADRGLAGRGLARVILGTVAVRDPDLVKEACRKFPGKIAVGIDARGGKVAVEGWAEASSLGVIELAQEIRGRGRRGHHLHRHRPRRRSGRHQLGRDDRACRGGVDPGDRLGRAGLDRRHRAHDHAGREKARRRDLRPRAL